MKTKQRILLTGATGFLGRQVARALADRGHHVIGVARGDATDPAVAEWLNADLLHCDMQRLVDESRTDTLVHMAWTTQHGRFWSAKDNLDWIGATLNLMRAFERVSGKRAVFAGSCAEYDLTTTVDAYSETDDTPTPATLYGTSKDAARRVCETFCRDAGISFAWARVFFLFGPHEDPNRLGGSIARALVTGEDARCSSGTQVRDFLSTQDAGDAIAALTASKVQGAVNIGSGTAMTIADFAKVFGHATGYPERIHLGALPDRPDDPARIVANISRLEKEVGFRPQASFNQRVHETLDWWRETMANR